MKFRRSKRQESSIELTPLIDVVLLLLIFFMVTSTHVRENVLSILLPEAHGETMTASARVMEIFISRDGEVLIGDQEVSHVSYSGIQTHVRTSFEDYRGMHVQIRADADARHAIVVQVLDALGGLGVTNVRILATEPQNPDS